MATSHTVDVLIYLRNRDFAGLTEWLMRLLELGKDDAREHNGRAPYDGYLLVPLLQSGDVEVSQALLSNSELRGAMVAKELEHDGWLLDLLVQDPFAWIWALEQGWGQVVQPRPSVLKGMTVMRLRDHLETYLSKPDRLADDRCDASRAQEAWDGWMRTANARNPSLTTHMYTPQRDELERVALCTQSVSFRAHFRDTIERLYPGAAQMRTQALLAYEGIGLPFDSQAEKNVLAKALGLTPLVQESIALDFDSAH